jgi:uncharacterized membrane protein
MNVAGQSKQNVVESLLRPLVTGILALLPITLTVVVIFWVVDFIASAIGPGSAFGGFIKRIGWNIGPTESGAYLGGALFAILLIYLLGILLEYVLKERGERIIGGILSRIPLVGSVYETARKIVATVEPRQGTDLESMTPVMCSFGGDKTSCIPGFLPTSEILTIDGIEYHVVMIPTAPVPFGGAILCVRKERVTKLDCGIDGLFNIYMSMGTAMPDYLRPDAASGSNR